MAASKKASNGWKGFRFTGYFLENTAELALNQENSSSENLPTTIGEVYERLHGKRFRIEDNTLHIEIRTDVETLKFSGPSFNRAMLYEVLRQELNFRNDEDEMRGRASWYWYDSYREPAAPGESHFFFVEFNGKIVREAVIFFEGPESGFEPTCFFEHDNSDPRAEAETRFWYRKFYTETRAGQLMVLRKDAPKLYDYDSQREPQTVSALLKRIQILLWILIGIGGLILARLWR